MSDVTDLLGQLSDGSVTVADVADQFRRRQWPSAAKPDTTDYTALARRTVTDPDAPPPGSFLEVAAAWHDGTLTDDQFTALAQAAADAIKGQQPQPGTAAVAPTPTPATPGGTS
jgi:hypothetical protein